MIRKEWLPKFNKIVTMIHIVVNDFFASLTTGIVALIRVENRIFKSGTLIMQRSLSNLLIIWMLNNDINQIINGSIFRRSFAIQFLYCIRVRLNQVDFKLSIDFKIGNSKYFSSIIDSKSYCFILE